MDGEEFIRKYYRSHSRLYSLFHSKFFGDVVAVLN
jgi:hypothetical protein